MRLSINSGKPIRVQPEINGDHTNNMLALRDVLSQHGDSPDRISRACLDRLEVSHGILRKQYTTCGAPTQDYAQLASYIRDDQKLLHRELRNAARETYDEIERIIRCGIGITGPNVLTAIELVILNRYTLQELCELINTCQRNRKLDLPIALLKFLTVGRRMHENAEHNNFHLPNRQAIENHLERWAMGDDVFQGMFL